MSSELELIQKAVSGNREAQFNLGKIYRDGLLVDRDFNKAKKWFSAASDQGHVRAKYELARILEQENSELTVDAVRLLVEAARGADNDASLYLEKLYRDGKYEDLEEVLSALRKCSDGGSNACKLRLAELLYRSNSNEDRLESIKLCYELSIEGDKNAMFRLYLQYRYAVGTKIDMKIAKMWLQKAAENGHKGAKEELKKLSERDFIAYIR